MASGSIPVGANETTTRSQRIDLQLGRTVIATLARLRNAPFRWVGHLVRSLTPTPAELDDILGLAQALAA